MRQSGTVIVGNRRITTIGTLILRISPAGETADQISRQVDRIEERDKEGFALGVVDFEVLMASIRDLDQATPLEIGLSRDLIGSNTRLLRLRHGETKIYIAGMSLTPSECEEDALETLQAENEVLKKRVAELESKCDPVAVFVGVGAGP